MLDALISGAAAGVGAVLIQWLVRRDKRIQQERGTIDLQDIKKQEERRRRDAASYVAGHRLARRLRGK